MIVKNEAHNLGRCLASLRGAVDEVVVVDTGSSDDTIQVARSGGARVFEFPWCDDFSAARNESLRLASGDWLIWIDADEELVEAIPGALRTICRQLPASYQGCWIPSHSLSNEEGEVGIVARQWRLLRNHAGIRFSGRIHEQLMLPSGGQPKIAPQDAVHTRHWGYLPKGDVLRRKAERNLRLLELAISEEPANPQHYFNLGLQHSFARDFEPALAAFRRAIELWRRSPSAAGWVPGMFSSAAFVAVNLQRYDVALDVEERTPPEYVSTDLVYFAGIACWRTGRVDDAVARLRRAATDRAILHEELHPQSTSTWRPRAGLAGIYDRLQQYDVAYQHARDALALAPDHPELLFGAADLADKVGRTDEALDLVRQLLAGERDFGYKQHGRRLMLQLAERLGSAELTLEALASGAAYQVSERDSLYAQARAHAHLGARAQALALLEQACRRFPHDQQLGRALLEARAGAWQG
ncbi:MAG: glycosyltransferase [Chloroflexota bacterium]|nr:glycosyltransferase [Chloroflexota bacterium]